MRNKKILIRFDDICPTMNWELWQKAERLLDSYGIKPLLGVIPNSTDPDLKINPDRPDFWEWLKKKQSEGYVIAMHGLNHVFNSSNRGILTTRIGSEFAGIPYEEQVLKIRKGKEILEDHGIHTDIFFAPGHSYDENTVKALSTCGFKYISDGKGGKSYVWHGVKFLPCRNTGGDFNLREQYSTAIYHAHEWGIKGKNAYPELERIIKTRKDNIVDFEDYKKQPIGNTYLQLLIERIYVWLQFTINPIVKQIIKKLWK